MPFFSIGVTAYNRPELLRQTLSSVLGQTFEDFEVIVGNDYAQEPLSGEIFGIDDRRVRFVNHPQNLGEAENMRALLSMSRGRYVTWLADDDLYTPDYLQRVYETLSMFDFPPCVFTSYEVITGAASPGIVSYGSERVSLLTGREFLRMYCRGRVKAIGTYGMFDAEHLRCIGGIERLCGGPIALYSEYLLLIRSGLLQHIAYIDAPLVFYRAHRGAWGWSRTDNDQRMRAAENLILKSIEVLKMPGLRRDFYQNFKSILKLISSYFVDQVSERYGPMTPQQAMAFLCSIHRQLHPLKASPLYWLALASLVQDAARLAWHIARGRASSIVPAGLKSVVRTMRAYRG